MKFASPEFLYALIAIAIPIIIHLFNFRKFKKVYFSNVEFLKEVQQETQSKSQLKHLLILLSRILAIAFLVFAFAQPFIPINKEGNGNQNNVVGIYIDNSFSMESTGEDGSLLDEAKAKAINVVGSFRATDKFTLLTNDYQIADQRLLTNEEVIDKIEQVVVSSRTKILSSISSRNLTAVNVAENANKVFYVFSDFQKTISDFENVISDSLLTTYFIPIKANERNNLYIDSCWFNTPTHILFQQEELNVNVKNNGNIDLEKIPLKLHINGKMIAPSTFNIKANEQKTITLNYTNKSNGIQKGKVELQDAPVSMDDAFYFSYSIADNISILNIHNGENTTALSAIYNTDSIFNYKEYPVKQLDYSKIKKSDLVIVNNLETINSGLANALKSFVDKGGSLIVLPSSKIKIENYKEFLSLLTINYFTAIDTNKTKVKTIHYQHPIFNNVFDEKPKGNLNLPIVFQHYIESKNTTTFKTKVLTLKNGDAFLSAYQVGKGNVYLCATSIDKSASSFVNHALFVPTFYNMALLSQKNYPLFYVIGNDYTLDVPVLKKDNTYHVIGGNFDVIPLTKNNNKGTTVFVNTGVELAGNYTLTNQKSSIGLAYNYNRLESDLKTYSNEEIQHEIEVNSLNAELVSSTGSVKTVLSELNTGKRYWKYCIILALLFLAIEIALIKLLK
jgi:hypothetical protein